MTASNPARSSSERADQTRTRILEAAIGEFSEKGLAGARTEQIAEAAGVNKALLYYYFTSKEALYSAALESVVEGVRTSSFAVLEADIPADERFLQMVLNHFDRLHSNRPFQSLMQQEMIRMQRGEENELAPLAEKLIQPLWLRVRAVVEEGIAAGELVQAEWTQMIYAGLGANVFYFLSAPMTKPALGFDPLSRASLEFRRQAAIEFLGQAVFFDRENGKRVAARVLKATPMPEPAPSLAHPVAMQETSKTRIETAIAVESKTGGAHEVRQK